MPKTAFSEKQPFPLDIPYLKRRSRGEGSAEEVTGRLALDQPSEHPEETHISFSTQEGKLAEGTPYSKESDS